MSSLQGCLVICVCTLLSACGSTRGPLVQQPIAMTAVPVQYGVDGAIKDAITISSEQWRQVRSHFEPPSASAEDERERIAEAIATLYQIAGTQTPIKDAPAMGSGFTPSPGTMDCVDNSTNTTTFLALLDQHRVLRHHRVMQPVWRVGPMLLTHRSALIEEVAPTPQAGSQWVVDSWFGTCGERPLIQRVEDWVDRKADPKPVW